MRVRTHVFTSLVESISPDADSWCETVPCNHKDRDVLGPTNRQLHEAGTKHGRGRLQMVPDALGHTDDT